MKAEKDHDSRGFKGSANLLQIILQTASPLLRKSTAITATVLIGRGKTYFRTVSIGFQQERQIMKMSEVNSCS